VIDRPDKAIGALRRGLKLGVDGTTLTAGRDDASTGFDPFGPAFRDDPPLFHPMLLGHSPMFVDMEGVPSAVVSTHAQVSALLRDHKGFSSSKPPGLPGMERVDYFKSTPVMNYCDPPEHNRRRKVVNAAFTPKRTAGVIAQAEALVDRLLDDCAARPRFDAFADLARPITIHTLLSYFIGLSREEHGIFLDFAATFPLLTDLRPGDPKPEPFLRAWDRGVAFCRARHEQAKAGGEGGLIGLIATSAGKGEIDDDEMMALMMGLITGGLTTVAGAIAASVMQLAREPAVAERVRADGVLAAAMLEEAMRLDPPATSLMRFATADCTIGDRAIPAGMPIYAMIASACRDPQVFPDPDRFDIDRPNLRDHLAFGHGIHACIGANITRGLLPSIIYAVANRLPGLRIASEPGALDWDKLPRARHLNRLIVTTRGADAP